jgi:hypothetical protein
MSIDLRPDCACVVTSGDAESVYSLRVTEYAAAAEFEMTRPELLRWSEHDEAGVVIGIWHENELVSTLRAGVVPDRPTAEDEFACTVDLAASMFPALVFGHGATRTAFRRQGLNALLRFYFFQALQPVDGLIRASLTLVYEGAPRVNLLKTLGYEFSCPAKSWDPEARAVAPALLAVLPRNRVAAAQARLAAISATNIVRYPWFGEPLRIEEDVAVYTRVGSNAKHD